MPFYEFRSYVGTSGIIRESDQNPTTLVCTIVCSTYQNNQIKVSLKVSIQLSQSVQSQYIFLVGVKSIVVVLKVPKK